MILATGGVRQGLQDHVERAHPHRRRHGHRLAQGPAAGGHGVLPVPPDRPGRARHPAVRGRPRRGRDPAQRATASASWSGTRRPSRTSRRATSWRGRWPTRSAKAAAAVRTRTTCYLDLTHLEPAHIDAKLPDITEFARTYLGVEPYTEPVPVYPTAHYAMGGVPTNIEAEVLRDNDHVVPGLYAAGEVACVSVHGANRLGTNSLLDINVFGRRAGIAAAEYALGPHHVELPAAAGGDRARHARPRCGTARAASASPTSAPAAGDDGPNAQVFRTEASLKQALSDIERSEARGTRTCPCRTRDIGSTPTCSRPSSSASCSTWPRCSSSPRSRAQGVPRRPLPRGLPHPRRRQLHAAHHGLPHHQLRGRAGDPPRLQAGRQTRYQPMERKY